MHELSLVLSIVETCEGIATKNEAKHVEEVLLEIGTMAGVELNAFDMAWKECTQHSLLQGTVLKIERIEALGRCMDCEYKFPIQHYYDACPQCQGHFIDVVCGKELRIKSILI